MPGTVDDSSGLRRPAGCSLLLIVIALAASAVPASEARAQAPELVKDICDSVTLGSDPQPAQLIDGRVVFIANGSTRTGVWSSDGTPTGTHLVRDIGCLRYWSIGTNGGEWHFAAYCNIRELQLWRTDGTFRGTTKFATIALSESSVGFRAGLVAAGRDYLLIEDAPDLELWTADGSASGTLQIARVADRTLVVNDFLVWNGTRLFFPGQDPDHGVELWASDGSAAGTGLVRDVAPGPVSATPRVGWGAVLGDDVYFSAFDPANGCQLWASDGTAEGTRLVKKLAAGESCREIPTPVGVVGNSVLFAASDGPGLTGLWRTKGAAETTEFVRAGSVRAVIGLLGSNLLYATGEEILKTDGTPAGTITLPAGNPPVSVSGAGMTAGARIYFPAYDSGRGGTELWASNGTPEGTGPIFDVYPGSAYSMPVPLCTSGDTLYFAATDTQHGRELWRTQGSAASTRMVADVNPSTLSATPLAIVSAGDSVYFWSSVCLNSMSLWRSGGTSETTVRLRANLWQGAAVQPPWEFFLPWGNGVLFTANDLEHGQELWRSDGTPEGTRMVVDLWPGASSSAPAYYASLGGEVVFAATTPEHGTELWATDGTPERTRLVADVLPGPASSTPANVTSIGSQAVFLADDGGGVALWRTDGSPAGTVRVMGQESGFLADRGVYNRFVVMSGVAYLTAQDGIHGKELWRTDGSHEGTRMVRDVFPPQLDTIGWTMALNLARIGDRLVFSAFDAVEDWEAWISDGTEAGTRRLKDINPGPAASGAALGSEFFDRGGGRFCFSAYEPTRGREVWCSDGTEQGTQRLAHLLEHPYALYLWDLAPLGERFVFSFSPQHVICDGCRNTPQLWVSDGTAENTRNVITPIPPDLRAMPFRMTVHGKCVYFPGFDDRHGWELWRFCDEPTRPPRRRVGR